MDNKFPNQNIEPLNTKINEKGNLEISGCDLVELAKKYSTPLYVMDKATLTKMAHDYKKAFLKYDLCFKSFNDRKHCKNIIKSWFWF